MSREGTAIRAVIQRVNNSKVTVSGKEVASIGKGLNVLLGVGREDSEAEAAYVAEKIAGLRIFEDGKTKLNLSVKDISGQILLISQFTLLANTARGRRPSFTQAAEPEKALELFNKTAELLMVQGLEVKTGRFGEHMVVDIENDGPVTVILEKDG